MHVLQLGLGQLCSRWFPWLLRCTVIRHVGVLLVLLVAADIVEIKHIMLPPSPRDFKDIYVVFELMETDLHQVRTA